MIDAAEFTTDAILEAVMKKHEATHVRIWVEGFPHSFEGRIQGTANYVSKSFIVLNTSSSGEPNYVYIQQDRIVAFNPV